MSNTITINSDLYGLLQECRGELMAVLSESNGGKVELRTRERAAAILRQIREAMARQEGRQ